MLNFKIFPFQGVEVIRTHSLSSSLQSVGGIQMLLPLFDQLDLPVEGEEEEEEKERPELWWVSRTYRRY